MTVRSGACLKSDSVPRAECSPHPDMPAWYPLHLDPAWQLSLKYSNSATELLSDLVAQLVRAWQVICQVLGLSSSPESPSLSFPLFGSLLLTDFDLG